MDDNNIAQNHQLITNDLPKGNNFNALIALGVERNSLLNQMCTLQQNTGLAVSALAEMSYTLITGMSLQGVGQGGAQASTLSGSVADWMGITAFSAQAANALTAGAAGKAVEELAKQYTKPFLISAGKNITTFGSQALTAAEALAAIPAAVAAGIIGLSAATFFIPLKILQYEVEQGWIERPNMDQMNETANSIDDIMAASNPFIYQGEDELAPGRKGGRAGRRLDEFKRRQETIEQATATLNTIGDIYAASNPHLYQPTATFNAWQTNQPQPTATFDGWQQQQTQLADIQAQTSQFWQTYSESTQNQPITLNVTNNFKGVTQDRKSLNEISDYMARQIRDDLNAGRPLYSHN
ncbi:MAG: hypothetical protein K0S22_124 [Oscillospiraceae bacterium]|jgi:hypothetical protein|nr:hypothetical protein [Oscillospiraceae bacterium]